MLRELSLKSNRLRTRESNPPTSARGGFHRNPDAHPDDTHSIPTTDLLPHRAANSDQDPSNAHVAHHRSLSPSLPSSLRPRRSQDHHQQHQNLLPQRKYSSRLRPRWSSSASPNSSSPSPTSPTSPASPSSPAPAPSPAVTSAVATEATRTNSPSLISLRSVQSQPAKPPLRPSSSFRSPFSRSSQQHQQQGDEATPHQEIPTGAASPTVSPLRRARTRIFEPRPPSSVAEKEQLLPASDTHPNPPLPHPNPPQTEKSPVPPQPNVEENSEEHKSPKRAPGYTSPLLSTAELLAWRPAGAHARCVSRIPLPASAVARYARAASASPTARPLQTPEMAFDELTSSSLNASSQTSSHRMGSSVNDRASAYQAPPVGGSSASVKRLQPPRLLLCHDFARGYPIWEACADGVVGDNCPPEAKLWRFNHWSYVDIFVYFSHYRVTIPPVGYIHAAHRHGALALGTLIFEWEDGAADLKTILSSFRVRSKAALQLATIAKFFGFDGWLVNVECKLANQTAAGDLAAFVAELSRATRKLCGAASEVIWYDSVTRSGELSWQNELNAENEPFFKAAGAIFTNYHWDRNGPVRSAIKAGSRRSDVFTGIDVHGRNTYGGGGFHSHVALRAIKQSGTSAAIFAPAWTVESCPPSVSNPLELEERFWTGPRGNFGRESVAQYFKERPVITELPFSTTFDPGWGPRSFKNGLIVDDRPYFNMARQEVQPSFLRTYVAAGDSSAASLSMSHDAALHGSASIRVRFGFAPSRMLSGTYTMLRLFIANATMSAPEAVEFNNVSGAVDRSSAATASDQRVSTLSAAVEKKKQSVRVAYDYYVKQGDRLSADDFGLVLLFSSSPRAILLVGEQSSWANESSAGVGFTASSTDGSRNLRPVMRLQILGKFVQCSIFTPTREQPIVGPPANDPGVWSTRVYDLPQNAILNQHLSEVMVLVGKPASQPLSLSPSPFMSPGQGSRADSRLPSRYGSRLGSRVVSRTASRSESRAASRHLSPSSSRPSSRDRSPPRADDKTSRIDEMRLGVVKPQDPFEGLHTPVLSPRSPKFAGHSRSYGRVIERAGLCEILDNDVEREGNVMFPNRRSTVGRGLDSDIATRIRQRQLQQDGRGGPNSLRRIGRPATESYGEAFAVGGEIDFSQMDFDDDDAMSSSSSSRVLSRISSRLGTPGMTRSTSRQLSRAGSRQLSARGSLAVSRTGSALPSRFVSPTRTPLSGGGGALPVLKASISGVGMRSGSGTPSSASAAAPIRDLKSALMRAAGAMAGVSVMEDEGHKSAVGGVVECRVYLGALRFEFYETNAEGELSSSSGFDNDFFNVEASSINTVAAFRTPSAGFQRSPSRKLLIS